MAKGKEFKRREFLGHGCSLGMAGFGILQLQRTGRSTGTRGLRIASTRESGSETVLGSLEYPREFPTPEWLEARGRLVFNQRITQKTSLEENWNLGVNMLGDLGEMWIWDGKDRIYEIKTGETVNTEEFRAFVARVHEHGMMAIGSYLRLWHPQLLYLEHPDWQELTSPDAKPFGPEHVKDWPQADPGQHQA